MIVMKFGGTSVEDAAAIERVCRIVGERAQHTRIAVVVSALAGVTDELLRIGNEAAHRDLAAAQPHARRLAARHLRVARALLGQDMGPLASLLRNRLAELEQLLSSVSTHRRLSPRATDELLAFGERCSSAILAAAMNARGLRAELLDARQFIITNAHHTAAAPLMEETVKRTRSAVRLVLQSGAVAVIPGFIAATKDGVPTTLGRGGSDLSGCLVGVALGAERIEIWTDVDGIMTADPRLCPEAQTVPEISFAEAAELAHFGGKVLQPGSLIPAIQRGIPVHVLNSRRPHHPGTRVHLGPSRQGVKAIAVKRGISVIKIKADRSFQGGNFHKHVFDALARHGCGAELVTTTDVSISLAMDRKHVIPAVATELQHITTVTHHNDTAIVAAVGAEIARACDSFAPMFAAFSDVPLRLVSVGASRLSIGFVVDEADVEVAVRRLHQALFAVRSRATA